MMPDGSTGTANQEDKKQNPSPDFPCGNRLRLRSLLVLPSLHADPGSHEASPGRIPLPGVFKHMVAKSPRAPDQGMHLGA